MAPTQPSHRTAAPTRSILKSTTNTNSSSKSKPKSKADTLFPTNKADKRRIKHANLISKITKPTSTSKPGRRRPSKKLVTTLDALADALPEADAAEANDVATTGIASQVNVISRKSMKSRPGALKRKQKLDNEERQRFGKNLAQLQQKQLQDGGGSVAATGSGGNMATATQDRWAALRGFIGETLERRPDIVVGKG